MSENDARPSHGVDQYDDVLRSMSEGLIISLNESTPKQPSSGELTVEYSYDDETGVYAKGFNGTDWKIHREGDKLLYSEITEDGLSFEDEVISIEILGLSGRSLNAAVEHSESETEGDSS